MNGEGRALLAQGKAHSLAALGSPADPPKDALSREELAALRMALSTILLGAHHRCRPDGDAAPKPSHNPRASCRHMAAVAGAKVGRARSMDFSPSMGLIRRGGFDNPEPSELEKALEQHPAVERRCSGSARRA